MLYICFEGPDGVGKTTVLNLVADQLRSQYPNINILITKEPGSPHVAPNVNIRQLIVNGHLTDELSFLLAFALDNLLHQAFLHQQNENTIVLADRCYISDLAYRVVPDDLFQKQTFLTVHQAVLQEFAKFNPIVILIDANPETALRRILSRSEKVNAFEKEKVIDHIATIRQKYFEFFGPDILQTYEAFGDFTTFYYTNELVGKELKAYIVNNNGELNQTVKQCVRVIQDEIHKCVNCVCI